MSNQPVTRRPAKTAISHATLPLSQVASVTQQLILDRFSPAAILLDADNAVLYHCGPIESFLRRRRGVPVKNLLLMVRESLHAHLRDALFEAAASQVTVVKAGARIRSIQGYIPVEITVTPHCREKFGTLYLVVLRQQGPAWVLPEGDTNEAAMVRHLEEVVQATRDDLQNTIERFEIASESLKATNDQLTLANQQLDAKVQALLACEQELKSLFDSGNMATLCINRACRIQRFTPAVTAFVPFLPGDWGRPLGDFSLTQAGDALIETTVAVMSSQTPHQLVYQLVTSPQPNPSGRQILRRVAPYFDEIGLVDGVVISFTDITDIAEDVHSNPADNGANRDLTEPRAQTDRLRTLSAALAVAEARERRSLAQDLHDDLGQMLALIKLKIASMSKLPVPDFMQAAMDDCAKAVDQANRRVRVMAFQLSPPMLDELGLPAAMEWMADEMHKMYKLDVVAEDDGKPKPLDPDVSATLFRAVRELLINTAKHANVTHAVVRTELTPDQQLLVTVSDAGAGFDPDQTLPANGQGGFGLLSVRERIQMMGGEVSIRSNPGDGTTVFITVPLLDTATTAPHR